LNEELNCRTVIPENRQKFAKIEDEMIQIHADLGLHGKIDYLHFMDEHSDFFQYGKYSIFFHMNEPLEHMIKKKLIHCFL